MWTVGTLAVLWVVCTSAGRAVLLRAISGEIEQKTGWSVGFGDTELSLRQGLLTLRDVTTGAPASAPVVQVSEIRAQWSWDTLFEDGLWTLDELALANPQVDLEAPFPTTEPTGAPPEPSPLPLVLQAWTIEAGEVRGRSMDEGWLEHWSIRDLHAAGAFTRGTLRGEIQRGTGTLAPRQPDAESEVWTRLAVPAESTDITLGGRFEGALQGPWTIDELKLLGQGIRLTGSSSLGRSADPAQLRFELDLQPGAWAPGLRGSGTIQAQGELDLRALQGELTVHAPDLPLEILEPFVSATIFDGLGARGTTMGLELDLQLDGPDPARAKGGARWQWSRRDRPGAPLGNFTATVTSAGALDLDAQLLPHFPGTLRASGTLVTEDLRRLELLRIEGGRLTVESASAGELRRALAPFWPAIPELADGALSLQVKASGKVVDPALQIRGHFRPTGRQSSLRWQARADTLRSVVVDAQLEGIRPGELAHSGCADPDGALPCSTRVSGAVSLDLGPTHSRAGGDLKLQAETGETVELEGLHLGTTGLTLALSGPGLTPQSFDRGLTGLLDDSRWRVEATLDTESLLLPAPTADPARNELPWQARNLGFHVLLRDRDVEITQTRGHVTGPWALQPIPLEWQARGASRTRPNP